MAQVLTRLLLPPAAAEGLIKLDQALKLVSSVLRQGELRAEQRALIIEYLQERGDPSAIAFEGSGDRVAEILHRDLLRQADLVILLVGNQGVGNILERALDGLLVRDQRLTLLRLGSTKVPAEPSGLKNGLRQLCSGAPSAQIEIDEARHGGSTGGAPVAGESNLRKECSFGHADLGIRSNEVLLGLKDVGTPLKQRGCKTRRDFGKEWLVDQRASAYHRVGIIAQKNTDGILFESELPFQLWNLRVGSIEHLPGLQDVECGSNAMIEPVLHKPHGIFLSLDGVAGDLQLQVEVKQREVIAGHITHKREDGGLAGVLAGQHLSTRRLGLAAQLTKKVELECGVGGIGSVSRLQQQAL